MVTAERRYGPCWLCVNNDNNCDLSTARDKTMMTMMMMMTMRKDNIIGTQNCRQKMQSDTLNRTESKHCLYSQKQQHENRLLTAICRAELDATQPCNMQYNTLHYLACIFITQQNKDTNLNMHIAYSKTTIMSTFA